MPCEQIQVLIQILYHCIEKHSSEIISFTIGVLAAILLPRIFSIISGRAQIHSPSLARMIETHTVSVLIAAALLIPPFTQMLISCFGYGGGQFQAEDLFGLYGAIIGVGATIGTFLWAREQERRARELQITPSIQIALSSAEDGFFLLSITNTREYPAFNLHIEGLPVANAALPQTPIYRRVSYPGHRPPSSIPSNNDVSKQRGEVCTQIGSNIEFTDYGLPSSISIQYTDMDRNPHSQTLRPVQAGSYLYAETNQIEPKSNS